MDAILEGRKITNDVEFHKQLKNVLDLAPYYGENLNALWDILSTEVERPVRLLWKDAEFSREKMGEEAFQMIVDILKAAQKHDEDAGWDERFELVLA